MKPIVAGLLVIFWSCTSSMKTTENKLTRSEAQSGWTSLFDGETLKGWRTYQHKPAETWSVVDGMLHCKGSTNEKGAQRADLLTNEQFENFELALDWKIAPQGNSGILYLVTEDFPSSYLSGPEYQLIDDVNFPQKLEDWQRTGANYAMNPPAAAAANAAGEWNHTRIVVNRGHVEHWLNGKKLVEYQLWTDEWKRNKAAGKWKDAPGYGLSKKGHLALQDHGSEAWFKNIKLKPL